MSAFLTARQAARVCGVSEKTIRRWIAAGRIVADKQGRDFRIPACEIAALSGQGAAPDNGQVADSGHGAATAAAAPHRDAAEWAALVRDLQAELLRRTEAAAMWQVRALMLEDRVRALEAPRPEQ